MIRLIGAIGLIAVLTASCDNRERGQKIVTYRKSIGNGWPIGFVQLSDSGFAICSNTSYDGVLLTRTTEAGDTLWSKHYPGGLASQMIRSVHGGFILGGAYFKSSQDLWFMEVDSIGNEMWSKTYDGIGRDNVMDICYSGDGGYIATGYFNSEQQMFIMKLNSQGDSTWSHVLPLGTLGRSIVVTPDNKITVVGLLATTTRSYDFFVSQFDQMGNYLHLDSIGTDGSESAHSICYDQEGFTIAGTQNTRSTLYIVASNSVFDTLWTLTLPGFVSEMIQTHNHDLILIGPDYIDIGIIPTFTKVSHNGKLLWQHNLPVQSATRVIETSDGGLAFIAFDQETGFLFKTDKEGNFETETP